MALKLSDLYREILENSKKPLAPIHSEISIVEKYLELEKLRFGEGLELQFRLLRRQHKRGSVASFCRL